MHHNRHRISLPPSLRTNYFVSFANAKGITDARIIQASSYASACAIARAQCKPFHKIHSIGPA